MYPAGQNYKERPGGERLRDGNHSTRTALQKEITLSHLNYFCVWDLQHVARSVNPSREHLYAWVDKVYKLQQCRAVCAAYAIKHESRGHTEVGRTDRQTCKSHITQNKYAGKSAHINPYLTMCNWTALHFTCAHSHKRRDESCMYSFIHEQSEERVNLFILAEASCQMCLCSCKNTAQRHQGEQVLVSERV